MSPLHFRRKEFLQGLQHHVAAFAIHAADRLYVLIEEAVAGDLICHHLVEGGRMQVCSLLELYKFIDYFGRRNNPSQANTRSQSLGECAQVNNISEGVSAVAPQVLAIEDQ